MSWQIAEETLHQTTTRRWVVLFLTLIRDEWRHLGRSSLGRGAFVLHALLTLLPLAMYFWIRERYVVVWPVDAAVVTLHLGSSMVVSILLVIACVFDIFRRGDREGWQDSFATMPLDELTWWFGRSIGRFSWIFCVLLTSWLVGWLGASIWVGHPLDGLPFLAGFLRGPFLALLIGFPIGALAGSVGNSLIGTCVVLGAGEMLFEVILAIIANLYHIANFSLIETLPLDSEFGLARVFSLLQVTVRGGNTGGVAESYYIDFAPDPGRAWPPFNLAGPDYQTLMFVVLSWLFLTAVAPSLLHLQRMAGRWQPRVKNLPTFSRWLVATIDEVRPTRPTSPGARVFSSLAGVGLVVIFTTALITAGQIRANQDALYSSILPEFRPAQPPASFVTEYRDLALEIADNGTLKGRATLTGHFPGGNRPAAVFDLATGLVVSRVTQASGKVVVWQQDNGTVRLDPCCETTCTFIVEYSGIPWREREPTGNETWLFRQNPRTWFLLQPLTWPAPHRHYYLDLRDLAWAPEGRASCWGSTELFLRMPSRFLPAPFPGDWHEEVWGPTRVIRWSGLCPRLPRLRAGHFRRLTRGENPSITAVVAGADSDVAGLVDRWDRLWQTLPSARYMPASVLVTSAPQNSRGWWEGSSPLYPRFYRQDLAEPPPLDLPPGMVEIDAQVAEMRCLPQANSVSQDLLRIAANKARAYARFVRIAPRLDRRDLLAPELLWQLCLALEWGQSRIGYWSPFSPKQQLLVADKSSFRAVSFDLKTPSTDEDSLQVFRAKVRMVVVATLAAIGGQDLEMGLENVAGSKETLDTDGLWRMAIGGRADELEWLRSNVLWGRGLARPRILSVKVVDDRPGLRFEITVANDGDAFTKVPLIIHVEGRTQRVIVPVNSNEKTAVTVNLNAKATEILLDPENTVLRGNVLKGKRWTPEGGVQ